MRGQEQPQGLLLLLHQAIYQLAVTFWPAGTSVPLVILLVTTLLVTAHS